MPIGIMLEFAWVGFCDSRSLPDWRPAMMVRPLSLDLRTRIAAALKDGMTVRAAATAVRIGQRDRSGRGLMPAKIVGYVKPTLRGRHGRCRAKVASKQIRLDGAACFVGGPEGCGYHRVSRHRLALPAQQGQDLKKTLVASEQDRPKVARFRKRWKTHQHRLDPDRLVFIDGEADKQSIARRTRSRPI